MHIQKTGFLEVKSQSGGGLSYNPANDLRHFIPAVFNTWLSSSVNAISSHPFWIRYAKHHGIKKKDMENIANQFAVMLSDIYQNRHQDNLTVDEALAASQVFVKEPGPAHFIFFYFLGRVCFGGFYTAMRAPTLSPDSDTPDHVKEWVRPIEAHIKESATPFYCRWVAKWLAWRKKEG